MLYLQNSFNFKLANTIYEFFRYYGHLRGYIFFKFAI